MTSGKNDLSASIDLADICRITDSLAATPAADLVRIMDYDDLQTAIVIRALYNYLKDQRCEPGFFLDLNNKGET